MKIYVKRNSVFQLLFILYASAILACPSNAQEDNEKDAMEATKNEMLAKYVSKWQETFEGSLDVLIADMSKVCDLDEDQIKKLKFAAKGAVSAGKKTILRQSDRMLNSLLGAGAMGGGAGPGIQVFGGGMRRFAPEGFPGAADPDEDEIEENAGELPAPIGGMGMGGIGGMGMSEEILFGLLNNSNAISVAGSLPNEKVWKKAVARVLSDDQKRKLEESSAERTAYRQRAFVSTFVAKVDERLLLTMEQRTKMIDHLQKSYGKQFATNNEMNAQFLVQMPNGQSQDRADEPIREILTESQLKMWKNEFQAKLTNIKMAAEMGGNNGVIGGGMLPGGGNMIPGGGNMIPGGGNMIPGGGNMIPRF